MHIKKLPDEMLLKIVECLGDDVPYYKIGPNMSPRPLINFRMVCRRFRDITDNVLVRSITVSCQPSSLARLTEISRHPSIRKGVRNLTVSLNHFSPELCDNFVLFVEFYAEKLLRFAELEWGTREESLRRGRWSDQYDEVNNIYTSWRRVINANSNATAETSEEDQAHFLLLKKAHDEYKAAYHQQEALMKDGAFIRTIASAMARMPAARSIEINDSLTGCTKPSWNIPVRSGVDV